MTVRKILFRGKRMDNGDWIYGHFFSDGDVATILPPTVLIGFGFRGWWIDDVFEPVDLETVGQFTGLTDKNGKNIFEGDIIRVEWKTAGRSPVHEKYSIVYSKSGFFLNGNEGLKGQVSNYAHSNCSGLSVEIIGNIHDNPELLTKNSAIDSTLDKP